MRQFSQSASIRSNDLQNKTVCREIKRCPLSKSIHLFKSLVWSKHFLLVIASMVVADDRGEHSQCTNTLPAQAQRQQRRRRQQILSWSSSFASFNWPICRPIPLVVRAGCCSIDCKLPLLMVMVTVVVVAVISGQFSCVSLFFSLVFCLICGVATCTNSSNISIIRECLHCVCVCEFSLCPRCLEVCCCCCKNWSPAPAPVSSLYSSAAWWLYTKHHWWKYVPGTLRRKEVRGYIATRK